MKVGNSTIKNAYVGNTAISKIWKGNTLVWESGYTYTIKAFELLAYTGDVNYIKASGANYAYLEGTVEESRAGYSSRTFKAYLRPVFTSDKFYVDDNNCIRAYNLGTELISEEASIQFNKVTYKTASAEKAQDPWEVKQQTNTCSEWDDTDPTNLTASAANINYKGDATTVYLDYNYQHHKLWTSGTQEDIDMSSTAQTPTSMTGSGSGWIGTEGYTIKASRVTSTQPLTKVFTVDSVTYQYPPNSVTSRTDAISLDVWQEAVEVIDDHIYTLETITDPVTVAYRPSKSYVTIRVTGIDELYKIYKIGGTQKERSLYSETADNNASLTYSSSTFGWTCPTETDEDGYATITGIGDNTTTSSHVLTITATSSDGSSTKTTTITQSEPDHYTLTVALDTTEGSVTNILVNGVQKSIGDTFEVYDIDSYNPIITVRNDDTSWSRKMYINAGSPWATVPAGGTTNLTCDWDVCKVAHDSYAGTLNVYMEDNDQTRFITTSVPLVSKDGGTVTLDLYNGETSEIDIIEYNTSAGVTINPDSFSTTGDKSVTVTVPANSTTSERDITIAIKLDASEDILDSITFRQEAGSMIYSISCDPTGALLPVESSTTTTIKSNGSWAVYNMYPDFTINPDNGGIDGTYTETVVTITNDSFIGESQNIEFDCNQQAGTSAIFTVNTI